MVEVIIKALVSIIIGHSLTNTGYWGGMRSAYLEEVEESSTADWLSKLCFKLTWGIVLKAVTPVKQLGG